MAKAAAPKKNANTDAPEDAFEARYKGLNPEQRDAVDTLEGPVMVIAGPGTGKTTVLTLRIANILRAAQEKKIPPTKPERILALTFTESGAAEMRRKLAALVGQDAYKVEISTFHGFANRIIQDHPDHFPEIVGASPITEIDQVDIVRRLLNASSLKLAKLKPFGDPYFYLRDIIRAITELKQQSVSPAMFAKIAEDDNERFYANPDLIHTSGKYEGKRKGKYDSALKKIEKNLELVRVYEAYQAELRKAKQYDYADMIMFVALALEADGDLRRALQSAYDYFLVDEHQDTNDAQNKIVELLVDEDAAPGKGPNLFVVGDEKQAIFRFQGASLENFHYFRTRYKGVKLIPLRSNYRSTQAILNAAQAVSPRETELKAEAGHKESPAHLAVLSAPDVETFFIAQRIQEIIKETSTAAEEIAVLYRDNKDAAPLTRMLERLHIPFNIESDQDVLGDHEIRKLVRVLRAVQHFGNDIWLAEALHADFLNIPPMDAYRMIAFAGRMRRVGAAKDAARNAGPVGRRTTIYDVLASAELQKEAGVVSQESVEAATTFAHNLSEWKRAAENDGAALAFEKIVRDSGFLAAVLRHPSGSEKLAKLHALFELLKSFTERNRRYSLRDFFNYLDLMEEHGVAVKAKDTTRMPGRVRLMTAHRSKGLEFDYVFIMGAVDRKWGSRFHRDSLTLPKGIYRMVKEAEAEVALGGDEDERDDDAAADAARDADERNVFYVALTRARKEVYVTMSRADREGKELLPTQFISEMNEDVLAPFDEEPYEKEFDARRAEVEFGQTAKENGKDGKNAAPAEKKPELMDKQFLNALFEAQGISVTALNNYLECPWHYFYVNLLRIPEAPNKHLAFGNAVHGALKQYFDELERGEDMGKVWMVARFEEGLAREAIAEHEYEETLEKGRKALPAFYDEYHAQWLAFRNGGGRAMNEIRVDGVTAGTGDGAVAINGKLDRVEILHDGEKGAAQDAARNEVHVIDYKTGRPKSRNELSGNTKNADGNYMRQLAFYKLLLGKEGRYDMTEGVIQFIERDERGKAHREAFEVTPGEVAVLEKLVVDVAGEIRDLAFWNKGCHEPDCEYCRLREGMG